MYILRNKTPCLLADLPSPVPPVPGNKQMIFKEILNFLCQLQGPYLSRQSNEIIRRKIRLSSWTW